MESNVAQERYCPGLDNWPATWGKHEREDITDRCGECDALVVYNPTPGEGPVRLICLECLNERPS